MYSSGLDIRILFGKRLRKLRTERGIAQEKLAEVAGLDRTYISKIEKGERNISLDTIGKLANALEIEVKEFFNP